MTVISAKISSKSDLSPLLKLAVPLAFTGLIQASSYFFETIFLAHLNDNALAAGSLAGWLFGTLAVILFGILSSINILVSHKFGGKDYHSISLIARDGIILAVLFSIPAFFFVWNMAPIFLWAGQSPAVVELAKEYMRAFAWSFPADFLLVACLEIIIGIGHARVILVVSLISVPIIVVSSYLLIFGKFGFPAFGIAGAGWGVTIGYWSTLFFLIVYIFISQEYRNYFSNIFTLKKPFFLVELLQVGLPIGTMFCFEVAFFLALTIMMGFFSSTIQAANQIALQYLGLLMSVIFSIAQAITVRMGHLLGKKDPLSARRAAYIGIFMAFMLLTIIGLLIWFYPQLLIMIDFDVNDPKNLYIIAAIKKFLMVSAIFQVFEATRIALFGALRGLKDTKFALMISLISFWMIALPIGYLFATILNLGPVGLWWGMVLGAGLSVMALYLRFNKLISKCIYKQ